METARLRPSPATLEAALTRWDLATARVELAAERENQVFRITSSEGCYALRFHRPGYRNTAELVSELAWTRALAEGGLLVAGVVPSVAGRLIEELVD